MGKLKHNRISFNENHGQKGNFRRNDRSSNQSNDQNDKEEQTEIHFMQPELLSDEMMVDLLTKRGANTALLRNKDKKFIVKLFYIHITPKPQRTYKNNRVGKLLQSKIKKSTINYADEWNVKILSNGKKPISTSSSSAKSNRPPITFNSESSSSPSNKQSSLNFNIVDRKKVSLNSSNSLSQIVIKKKEPAITSSTTSPVKKIDLQHNLSVTRKIIKLNSNISSPPKQESSVCKLVDRKKLNLKPASALSVNSNKVVAEESKSNKRKISEDSPKIVKLKRTDLTNKCVNLESKEGQCVNEDNSKRKSDEDINDFVKLQRKSLNTTSDSTEDKKKKKKKKNRPSIGWP